MTSLFCHLKYSVVGNFLDTRKICKLTQLYRSWRRKKMLFVSLFVCYPFLLSTDLFHSVYKRRCHCSCCEARQKKQQETQRQDLVSLFTLDLAFLISNLIQTSTLSYLLICSFCNRNPEVTVVKHIRNEKHKAKLLILLMYDPMM